MAGRWYAALGVNLLLGVPAVVPIWLVWFLAASWVGPREPTENDGMALWLVIIVPVVALYALLWCAANRPLARRSSLAARAYWSLSVLGTLTPAAGLVLVAP
jgi:hypothetical protein